MAGEDPVHSVRAWLVLAGSVLVLVLLGVAVGRMRRRPGSARAHRGLTAAAVVVGLAALFVGFGALDALLPPSL